MKIDPILYGRLRDSIRDCIPDADRLRESYSSRGLSDSRKVWDCFWASQFPIAELYDSGLNDSHIETALKRIGKELGYC